jgi:hypothetical protein
MEIVPVGIIIGQVDVFVVEEAVRREKVIGLVAGERDVLGNECERAEIIDEEGGTEKNGEPFSEGKALEPRRPCFDEEGTLLEEGKKSRDLKIENG